MKVQKGGKKDAEEGRDNGEVERALRGESVAQVPKMPRISHKMATPLSH